MVKKRRKRQTYGKSRSNKRRRPSRKKRQKQLLRVLPGLALLLVILLVFTGGYDYYHHGNIDRTLTHIEQVWEVAQTLPDKAGELKNWTQQKLGELTGESSQDTAPSASLDPLPEYTGETYAVINDNIPQFTEEERSSDAYEAYSELDALGRCGMAEAMITTEIMPTQERGQIGQVRPTGWHTVKYDNVDGLYLYNRCHLIAFELAGENANEKNLITGTRYMNVSGMLPWENMVAQYVRRTKGKVLYRVTPIFEGDNLVASGVHMEAESIGSDEIQFNIYVFNVQPGIGIDYANGNSWQE